MCTFTFHHQNAEQNHNIRISNKYFTYNYKFYKTIILPVILYGCENWSLTLREEYKLRVFENRVQRRIFGLKGDEVTGGLRGLHNEELHNSLPNITRMIKLRSIG
jgi:hypothetical protein